MDTKIKTCCRCKKELPATLEFFVRDKRKKDGFGYACRVCIGGRYIKQPKKGYKFCNKCNREFPATREFFHIGRRNKNGLIPICKECRGFRFGKPKEVIVPRDGYKICPKCKRELPANHGYFDRCVTNKDGFQIYCKECRGRKFKRIPKEGFRICSKCDKELPLKNFYKRTNGNYDGLCKKCKALKGKRDHHVRKSRKLKTLSNYSVNDWIYCMTYFKNRCAYCGERTQLTQDHFIPLAKGGHYIRSNIIPACMKCNSSKNSNNFSEWYPKQEFYSKEREQKIIKYLNKNTNLWEAIS